MPNLCSQDVSWDGNRNWICFHSNNTKHENIAWRTILGIYFKRYVVLCFCFLSFSVCLSVVVSGCSWCFWCFIPLYCVLLQTFFMVFTHQTTSRVQVTRANQTSSAWALQGAYTLVWNTLSPLCLTKSTLTKSIYWWICMRIDIAVCTNIEAVCFTLQSLFVTCWTNFFFQEIVHSSLSFLRAECVRAVPILRSKTRVQQPCSFLVLEAKSKNNQVLGVKALLRVEGRTQNIFHLVFFLISSLTMETSSETTM